MKTTYLFLAAALLLPALASAQFDPNDADGSRAKAAAARKAAARKHGAAAAPAAQAQNKSAMDLALDEAVADPSADLDNLKGADRRVALIAKSRAGSAIGSLSSLRSSLMIYYGDTEGQYPPDLQTLVPKQADSIPELHLPGHPRTNKVTVVKNLAAKGDDIRKAVRNTGGWLYIADPASKHYGEVFIDSVLRYKGVPLYSK